MHGYLHFPVPRGRVRTTVDRILLRLLSDAWSDEWDVFDAAGGAVERAQGNAVVLRRARSKVLRAMQSCPTRAGERALAALAIALEDVERPAVPAGPRGRA